MTVVIKKSNQTNSLDYCWGMGNIQDVLGVLDATHKEGIDYLKIGDNYMFITNHKDIDFDEGICLRHDVSFTNYKALMMIRETKYDGPHGFVDYYTLFGTNDEKKIEKFKAYYKVFTTDPDNELNEDLPNMEGKVFPGYSGRVRQAANGMYVR